MGRTYKDEVLQVFWVFGHDFRDMKTGAIFDEVVENCLMAAVEKLRDRLVLIWVLQRSEHTRIESMHQSSHPKLLTTNPREYILIKVVIVART